MLSFQILSAILFALVATSVQAAPAEIIGKRCSASATTYAGVATAVATKCLTLSIGGFTVPSGSLLDLSGLAKGTTVTVTGDITFASGTDWAGPMFEIAGTSITFNGGGYTFNGNGQDYWDGLGSNGGVTKPKFMKIKNSGTFTDLIVLNSPVQAISVGNSAALTISKVTVNNKAGDSGGGHNTDGFDVSATDVTIDSCTVYNQDDCLAINSGSDITFSNNVCSGGHGISIGSIASDKVVDTVTISGNSVIDSTNGLRIKTVYGATSASVSNVVYSNNKVTSATTYGVVIEQDYENGSPTGTATNGVTIENVSFTGTNTVTAASGGEEVYVLCGSGSCTGTWNWSGLKTSGGSAGSISGSPPITGYTLA